MKATICDQRGVALPLALISLLVLTALVMAFLTVSAFEPQIAANHQREAQARGVAEAGLEWAFDHLVTNTATWNTELANGGVLASAQPLPGLSAASGTYTVTIRNDIQAGDDKMTGVAVEPNTNAANDTNNRIIVTASGTVGNATRTITAVVRKGEIPPFNAALAFPGVQSDVNFSGSSFEIKGQDHNMDARSALIWRSSASRSRAIVPTTRSSSRMRSPTTSRMTSRAATRRTATPQTVTASPAAPTRSRRTRR
jgi:Tfp pilus assembly protein PilX